MSAKPSAAEIDGAATGQRWLASQKALFSLTTSTEAEGVPQNKLSAGRFSILFSQQSTQAEAWLKRQCALPDTERQHAMLSSGN